MSEQFEYLTIEEASGELARSGGFSVYGHGVWPKGSVLEGEPKRAFLGLFPTAAEAQRAFPDAEVIEGNSRVEIRISKEPPAWFDPMDAGEVWDEDDY